MLQSTAVRFIELLATLVMGLQFTGAEAAGPHLYPFTQYPLAQGEKQSLGYLSRHPKWGFIDAEGRVAIAPRFFDEVGEFSEGLACARVDRKWIYVDTAGEAVIQLPVPSSDCFPFSDGRARFQPPTQQNEASSPLKRAKDQQKVGFIDREGKVVIPPRYDDARDFKEGMAAVKADQLWGYLDTEGKTVIAPQFDIAGDFHDGLAAASVGDRYGYVDRSGKWVIEPRFTWTAKYMIPPEFSEGFAPVEIDGKHGYIDQSGKATIPPKFRSAGAFSEGLAPVEIRIDPKEP